MSLNVVTGFIKIVQEEIEAYMKIILERKYNKKIIDRFTQSYMNVRFYNFYIKDENLTFRKNYLNALKKAEVSIIEEFPDKKELIENIGLFYYYILYFDKISYKTDINEIIDKLYKIRAKLIKKKNEDFKEKMDTAFKEYANRKEEYLKKYETEEFFLRITDYPGANNANRVTLEYNFKFPMIYSDRAIRKTFMTGIIAEDKLQIEYNLLSVNVINDILRGNFKRQYIIEFEASLLKKSKKLKSLLNIINNPAMQDKVNLKIFYTDFIKNKEKIYDYMREGYRFALYLDDTLIPSASNLEKLNAFSYVVINKNLKYYNEIIENKEILKSTIEI